MIKFIFILERIKMSDSRTNNSLKNIAASAIYQIVTIVFQFFNRSIFIRVLGVEYLGINGLFSNILQMLCLADLGLQTAAVYAMYKPLAENDERKLAALTNTYRKLYNVIAIVIASVGVLLIPFLKYLINLDKNIPYINIYYLFALANTVASYLVAYKTNILVADQKMFVLSKVRSYFYVFQTVSMSAVLLLTKNYFVYLGVQVLFTYATNFCISLEASKRYDFLKYKKEKLNREETKNLFSNIGAVMLNRISGLLVTATDNTLISIIVGTVAVGYYSNYSMMIMYLNNITNMVTSSLTASIGNLVIVENEQKRYQIFKVLQTASLMVCVFCSACLYLLMSDFITIWLGAEFLLPNSVLVVCVINFYFTSIVLPIWTFRQATGLYQRVKYVMLCTALLNLVLSIILGLKFGLTGIIIATSIARVLTYFWYEPPILFKEFLGESSKVYYIGVLKNIISTVLLIITGTLIFNNFVVKNWVTLLVKAACVGIFSLVWTIICYGRSEEFKWILQKISIKFK